MNSDELRSAEQALRDVLTGTNLEWVLGEVDAAIAAGVPEEKILRRRRPRQRSDDRSYSDPAEMAALYTVEDRPEFGSIEYGASSKNGTLVISTRKMTNEERVQLLLDALQRVLVELPEIEVATLKNLHVDENEPTIVRSAVRGVSFEPDETAQSRPGRSASLSDRVPLDHRELLRGLFTAVSREVRR
ncbi:hypothetical protein [Saccharopolyspora antimicrobica]|uniref:hypothetical protein n=1 Tax=Saccharopolyspora antimicrobica TaxID=455193 RepID=UPI000B8A0D93|nr:hypothetical protein [Saccharopolyspora antimicrobica]